MSAPVLNLGFTTPASAAVGAGASVGQGEGGAAGFEALLAALFGEAPAVAAEFAGEAKIAKPDEAETKDEASDSTDTPVGADAQALAAMLAATRIPAPSAPETAEEGETVETAPAAVRAGKAVPTPEFALAAETPAQEGEAAVETKIAPPAPATPQVGSAADQKPPPVAPTAPTSQATDLAAQQPEPEPEVAAETPTAAQLAAAPPAERPEPRRESRIDRGEARGVAGADPHPGEARGSSRAGTVAASDKPSTPVEHPANPGAQIELPEVAHNDTPQSRNHAPAETTPTANLAPLTAHAASPLVRGAPETVANLAAHILKKLEGRSTRFDVELEPAGMGRVDVRMEIGLNGRLTAALAFDNPNTAAELKSRAAELTRALEQAGFDVSGGLSFDVAGDQNRSRQESGGEQQAGSALRGRAFQAALEAAGETLDFPPGGQLNLRNRLMSGVDIRI